MRISLQCGNYMDAVRQMYLEGQRRWPTLSLAFEAFEAHCRGLLGGRAEDAAVRHGDDLFLACACALGNEEAVRVFERETLRVAEAAIRRIANDAEFVQETLQDIREKLLVGREPGIARYGGLGPLQAWVRVSATRAALDRCRALGRVAKTHVELSEKLAALESGPESALARACYGDAFQTALRNAVARLDAQERNVLRMHVAGHCSIDDIARVYSVHRATAARWLQRARERIYDTARRELAVTYRKLTDSEFRSLAMELGSALELSFVGKTLRSSSIASVTSQ